MTDEYGNVLSYRPLRRACDKPEIVFNQVRTMWPKKKPVRISDFQDEIEIEIKRFLKEKGIPCKTSKALGSPSAQRRKRKA